MNNLTYNFAVEDMWRQGATQVLALVMKAVFIHLVMRTLLSEVSIIFWAVDTENHLYGSHDLKKNMLVTIAIYSCLSVRHVQCMK